MGVGGGAVNLSGQGSSIQQSFAELVNLGIAYEISNFILPSEYSLGLGNVEPRYSNLPRNTHRHRVLYFSLGYVLFKRWYIHEINGYGGIPWFDDQLTAAKDKPKKTANMQRLKLNRLYSAKVWYWPDCSNSKFSKANVEKVVNPPQNPVINSKRHSGENHSNLFARPKNTPIAKQPTMFTAKVP